MLLHIATAEDWQKAQAIGEYVPFAFGSEGFIHCSTPEQIVRVANLRFKGTKGLKLLRIDEALFRAEVRYENLEGGEELFPHIYGPLPLDAVTGVFEFESNDGIFTMPAGVLNPG